jgi:hypothetical protein
MNPKVIFIAGTGHSGSTLLEAFISGASDSIGLGEVFQLVDRRNSIIEQLEEHRCSCGDFVTDCSFWKEAIAELRNIPREAENVRYRLIYDKFIASFGPEHVLIDSSKVPEALELLAQVNFVDLHVIHLVRDIRAWIVSMQDSYRRHNIRTLAQNWRSKGLLWGTLKYIQRSPLSDAHYWVAQNIRIDDIIRKYDLKSIVVNYEKFCFDTTKVRNEIEKFLQIKIPEYGTRELSNNHSIFGNRMRFEPVKLAHISYDHKWLYRKEWVLPWLLNSKAVRLNNLYCNSIANP